MSSQLLDDMSRLYPAPVLPQSDGWLPKWQLLVAAFATSNTIQNFVTLKFTRRIYSGVPPASLTALQARTFAIWTLTSAVVRAYAAYNIHHKIVYDLALLTYLLAFAHFASELLIFRTAQIASGAFVPFMVATSSLIWMVRQYDFYVKA